MTKQEGAIITAYTGNQCCPFSDFHAYSEKKLGRQIFTHEFANQKVCDELREKSHFDFMQLMDNME